MNDPFKYNPFNKHLIYMPKSDTTYITQKRLFDMLIQNGVVPREPKKDLTSAIQKGLVLIYAVTCLIYAP